MRQVVAAEYLTLDGVTEDPGPSGDFAKRGMRIDRFRIDAQTLQIHLYCVFEVVACPDAPALLKKARRSLLLFFGNLPISFGNVFSVVCHFKYPLA